MRVHRSYIVNLEKIETIERSCSIFGKTFIPVSDQYKEKFQEFLDRIFCKRVVAPPDSSGASRAGHTT